ncbi:MAG: uracil-DNA glycosylase family protein [Acidiferrobacterales bacterium]|nr:uracil-DNA glycosylase family protein [Acidiferrobacterales bacterium]
MTQSLSLLLDEIRHCTICEEHLPLGCRPVIQATASAKLLIIGQAPGIKVHESGIAWNDASGQRLRQWLNLDDDVFYDEKRVAIMPMGFCYPGRGKSGDLPPRPECAVTWHRQLIEQLPNIQLTLLIGNYAQQYYLPGQHKTLTERVLKWRDFSPNVFPLVHPSPRNQLWLRKNPWFELNVIPHLQKRVAELWCE